MPGNADILPLAPGRPLVRSVGRLARAMARQLSGFSRLEKMADTLPQCGDPHTFAVACLTALDINPECLRGDLERIPAEGPVDVEAASKFFAVLAECGGEEVTGGLTAVPDGLFYTGD